MGCQPSAHFLTVGSSTKVIFLITVHTSHSLTSFKSEKKGFQTHRTSEWYTFYESNHKHRLTIDFLIMELSSYNARYIFF